jgi:hypothetical protein
VTLVENDAVVLSPTVARLARRSLVWVALGLLTVVIAIVVLVTVHASTSQDPLSATSPAPNGSKGLVTALRDHGVDVVTAGSIDEVSRQIVDRGATTLMYYDPNGYLTPDQVAHLDQLSSDVVLVEPTFDTLQQFAPTVLSAGFTDETATATCSYPAATRAEKISTGGSNFRVTDDSEAIECFAVGDAYSLIVVSHGTETVTVLGATDALTNEAILDYGNAALAVNVLGASQRLVWYIPTAADLGEQDLVLSDLEADWVQPGAILLFIVGFAAILWRGRRLGPLVVENLPVTVRASETMHGRARLYEKAGARLHALDSLRIGTIARLARLVGLSSVATVEDVIGLVSVHSGRQPGELRHLLVDARPTSDRDLIELSDQLIELERAVSTAVRP